MNVCRENASFEAETDFFSSADSYSLGYRVVAVTLSAAVFSIGFVGNALVVVVIGRSRSMQTPTNCYLLSLAVADCIVLISAALPAIPETFFRVDEWPFGRVLCPLMIFVQYVGVDASSLFITAFTVERYIAVCHPIKAQTLCTRSRAKKITIALWVSTTIYCSPWLGLAQVVVRHAEDGSNIATCQFRIARSKYLFLYFCDLIMFYLLPLVIAVILYCLMGRILVKSNVRLSRNVTGTMETRAQGNSVFRNQQNHRRVLKTVRRANNHVQV